MDWFDLKKKPFPDRESRCKPCKSFMHYLRRKAVQLARETQAPVTEQQCSRCKMVLPRPSFSKAESTRSGLCSICRSCVSRDYMIWHKERKDYRSVQPAVAPEGKKQECYVCNIVKPWKDFSKDLRSNVGIHSACKECAKKFYKVSKESQ